MIWRRTGQVLTTTLAVGIVIAGCGGGNDTSSPTTATASTISKADFVAQANAICDKGNQVTDSAGAQLGENPSQAQLTELISKTFVPSIQGQIDAIKALGAPVGDEATVAKMLSLAQDNLDQLESDPSQIENPKLFANFAKVAHPYGLTSCAQSN
jgi:hypothetical protein